MEYEANREPGRVVRGVQPESAGYVTPDWRQRLAVRADDFAHVARLRLRQGRFHLAMWRNDASVGVQRKPLPAMLGALALGFFVGFLLRRRQLLNREEVSLG